MNWQSAYKWVSSLHHRANSHWLSILFFTLIAKLVKNLPAMWETWVGKIPWRRERLPTHIFWPREFHGLNSHKELDTSEQLSLFSFPGGSVGKEATCNAGDLVSTSGSGRSPGEGNGNQLQYSCLEVSMNRGACKATVLRLQRVKHNWATNTFPFAVFSWVQLLTCVQLYVTPWTAARQASLSITNSWSLLKFMSIALVMLSNHLILCHPLLLPPSIFSSIRVFSSESVLRIRWPEYWSFSFSISPSLCRVGIVLRTLQIMVWLSFTTIC